MSGPGFATAHLDEVPTLSFASAEEPDWKPLRHHLGVGAFGVNAWVAAAAATGRDRHRAP